MFRETIFEKRHRLGSRPLQEAEGGQCTQRCHSTKEPLLQKLASAAGGVGGEGVAVEKKERQRGGQGQIDLEAL